VYEIFSSTLPLDDVNYFFSFYAITVVSY